MKIEGLKIGNNVVEAGTQQNMKKFLQLDNDGEVRAYEEKTKNEKDFIGPFCKPDDIQQYLLEYVCIPGNDKSTRKRKL